MSLRQTFEDCAVQSIAEILEEILPGEQQDLDREISRATGDSRETISQHGFVRLRSFPIERDPEDLIVDWDALDLERNVSVVS
ncbi:hypothetical protein [Planctomyces sp. SH-PL14]|uniref:hypothetical protein n=1 Tax=Planctomyces sp. SH-PL14 TaxID=1632864 RepID=UPI00078BEE7A|nr:hypothetical protein [Planctomyces sp. SH-PL14]AMV19212.1 hypothetical protein VT03_15080 [Planctomyces sp. SH-PL14]